MKINLKAFKIVSVLPVILLIMLVACKSPTSPTGDDCENVAGSWSITEVADETDCGEGINTRYYSAVIIQIDCDITVTMEGVSYDGEVDGHRVEWTGSYPEDGGTTTATINLTVSGNTISGTASWTWSDAYESCSGTSTITGSKT